MSVFIQYNRRFIMGADILGFLAAFTIEVSNFISVIFNHIPFSTATWFVIGILWICTWVFIKASKNPSSPVRWEHLIVDSATDRTSPYKLGYLIGVIIATWVVITLLDKQTLGIDILGVYLTYLVGGAGFTEWLKHGKDLDSTTSAKNSSD